MNTTARPPERRFLRGVFVCPRCGNDVVEAVSDGDDTNFLCEECWTCWHWELAHVTPVPPATCPGCYRKEECLRRSAAMVESQTTQPS